MRDVQDKVNVLLKPYHETLGITIEKCKGPEKNSVRIIFRTPSSKTCQVKLGNVDNRIKSKWYFTVSFTVETIY